MHGAKVKNRNVSETGSVSIFRQLLSLVYWSKTPHLHPVPKIYKPKHPYAYQTFVMQISIYASSPFHRGQQMIQLKKTVICLENWMMSKVQKPNNAKCIRLLQPRSHHMTC